MSVRFHATPAQFPTEKVNSFNTKFQTGLLVTSLFQSKHAKAFHRNISIVWKWYGPHLKLTFINHA